MFNPTMRYSRWLLVLSLLAAFAGWSAFFTAVIQASLHTVSHPMPWWAWIPGAVIWPGVLFTLAAMPARADWQAELAVYEKQVTCRMTMTMMLVGAGLMSGLLTTVYTWYAPPDHKASSTSTSPKFWSSPSPTPAPIKRWVPTEPDPVVGSLMIAHYGLLALSAWFMWLHANQEPRPEINNGDQVQDTV